MSNLLIQVFTAGLMFSGANNSFMVTHGEFRKPGGPPPITHTGPSECVTTEIVQQVGKLTYCRWQLQITASSTAATDRFYVPDGTVFDLVMAGQLGDPNWIVQIPNWEFHRCDINKDGTPGTEDDLLTYWANPYDWDGNEVLNINDFVGVLSKCGGE